MKANKVSKNILTKFQQTLPETLKTKIVKELIKRYYNWLDEDKYLIDDSFLPEYARNLKDFYNKGDE